MEGAIELRFEKLEREIDKRFAKVDAEFANWKSERLLIKWMLGFVLAFQVGIFYKLSLR